MSFNQSEHIGRPAPGVKKAKGLYRLSLLPGYVMNSGKISVFSEHAGHDPIIQTTADVPFKLTYSGQYKATFASINVTFNRFRLSSGLSTGDLLIEVKDHAQAGNCLDNLPKLTIAGQFIGNTSFYGGHRLAFDWAEGGGVGRTICFFNRAVSVIFKINEADIIATNLNQINSYNFSLTKL